MLNNMYPTILSLVVFATAAMSLAVPVTAQDAPETVTLFKNVNIFDGTNDGLRSGNVLIVNNLITEVGRDVEVPPGATVIDGGGHTLMPGLIDAHSHFNMIMPGGNAVLEAARWDQIGAIAAACAQEWLAEGFTTTRDMGGLGNGLKMTIDQGLLDGPRIYPSGSVITQTSGHGHFTLNSQTEPKESNLYRLGFIQVANGPEEVREAVRRNFYVGATQIKIMMGGGIASDISPLFAGNFLDAEVRAAVVEAATRDTYVATHVYQDAHIKRALELGVKSIEHGQFISEDTAMLLKAKEAFIAPYLAGILSEEIFMHPVFGKKGTPQYRKTVEAREAASNFVEIMNKVQPRIVFAVDQVGLVGIDGRKHRDHEKWMYADSFGNYTALKAFTSVGGELMQLTGKNNPYPHELGVIKPGAYADLLIVDGNPLEDITVLGGNPKWYSAEPRERGIESIRLIMKDGRVHKNTLK